MRTPVAILASFAAAVGTALLVSTMPVTAHHAFGAEFDPDAPVRLQGKIVKVEWVNPHAWIHMEIKKPDGSAEVWMVEGGTPNTLLRRGLTRDSLAYGTEIIVDGYQTKDHSLKRANGRDVTFTDGRRERRDDRYRSAHGVISPSAASCCALRGSARR